eukprot:2759410-Amphidinium_carterae.1
MASSSSDVNMLPVENSSGASTPIDFDQLSNTERLETFMEDMGYVTPEEAATHTDLHCLGSLAYQHFHAEFTHLVKPYLPNHVLSEQVVSDGTFWIHLSDNGIRKAIEHQNVGNRYVFPSFILIDGIQLKEMLSTTHWRETVAM